MSKANADFINSLKPGRVMWVHLKNQPAWPAQVIADDEVPKEVLQKKLVGVCICVKFFGDNSFGWVKQRKELHSWNGEFQEKFAAIKRKGLSEAVDLAAEYIDKHPAAGKALESSSVQTPRSNKKSSKTTAKRKKEDTTESESETEPEEETKKKKKKLTKKSDKGEDEIEELLGMIQKTEDGKTPKKGTKKSSKNDAPKSSKATPKKTPKTAKTVGSPQIKRTADTSDESENESGEGSENKSGEESENGSGEESTDDDEVKNNKTQKKKTSKKGDGSLDDLMSLITKEAPKVNKKTDRDNSEDSDSDSHSDSNEEKEGRLIQD